MKIQHARKSGKTLAAGIVLFCLTALLSGCGKKAKEITADPASLAASISESAVTSDTLTLTAETMIPTIYYIDQEAIDTACAYMSAGSTACEVVVVKCKESKQADAAKEQFKSRVASQSELYASYNQAEVAKLDKAIIKTAGNYAVLVVCDDTAKAESILKEAGF